MASSPAGLGADKGQRYIPRIKRDALVQKTGIIHNPHNDATLGMGFRQKTVVVSLSKSDPIALEVNSHSGYKDQGVGTEGLKWYSLDLRFPDSKGTFIQRTSEGPGVEGEAFVRPGYGEPPDDAQEGVTPECVEFDFSTKAHKSPNLLDAFLLDEPFDMGANLLVPRLGFFKGEGSSGCQ